MEIPTLVRVISERIRDHPTGEVSSPVIAGIGALPKSDRTRSSRWARNGHLVRAKDWQPIDLQRNANDAA